MKSSLRASLLFFVGVCGGKSYEVLKFRGGGGGGGGGVFALNPGITFSIINLLQRNGNIILFVVYIGFLCVQ